MRFHVRPLPLFGKGPFSLESRGHTGGGRRDSPRHTGSAARDRPTKREGVKTIPTPRKETTLAQTTERLSRANGYMVLDYRGLTVKEMSTLRRSLRAAGAEAVVLKNTLFRRAAAETNTVYDDAVFHGPTAIIFTYGDITEPAKVMAAFLKEHHKVHLKGGAYENTTLTDKQLAALATIPPKPVLLSQLAGGLQAPMANVASVLQAPLSQMARLLQALVDKQSAGAAA